MDLLFSFAELGFLVLLGVVAGGTSLFTNANEAIATLNRYALYVAFPALIITGLTGDAFTLPIEWMFWFIVPVSMLLTASIAYVAGWLPQLHASRGTLAMVGVFGNVAYVGLPLCERIWGESILGLASLSVSLFVIFSLLIGASLLLAWAPRRGKGPSPISLILKQPLLWAPIIGLALRWTPWLESVNAFIAPVGHSAAPVALFLLGLYLHTHRSSVLRLGGSAMAHLAMRMLVFPIILSALAVGALHVELLTREATQVLILLAATPTAVATFALAVEFEQGKDSVAQSIVLSTVLSALTLPLVSVWVTAL